MVPFQTEAAVPKTLTLKNLSDELYVDSRRLPRGTAAA
jgi:hypothetical protein